MGKKEKTVKDKPLDKMTATELRAIAMELPDITGAHGMNKSELIAVIKKAKGIEDAPSKKSRADASLRDVKAKIKELKNKRIAHRDEKNKKMVDVFRRRISKLKKKTRKTG